MPVNLHNNHKTTPTERGEGGMGEMSSEKAHAVFISFPFQSHVNALLKVAKLLHFRGFHITFVNIEYIHSRLVKSRGPDAVKGLPDFVFETIPDGLPPSEDPEAPQNMVAQSASIFDTGLGFFLDLLHRLDEQPSTPKVSCIVADISMAFAVDAAAELGVPCVVFPTVTACGYLATFQYKHLLAKGLVPLKDVSDYVNGYLNTPAGPVPGMADDMRLKDFPLFLLSTDPEDLIMNYILTFTDKSKEATAIILNSYELERASIDALARIVPPIYTLGPLNLLTRQLPDPELTGVSSSMWKEDPGCLDWLDGRAPGSVVYVNFGSITVMTNDQLAELAWGLANSEQDFLWVIRPDLVSGEKAIIPEECLAATKGRSHIASWCPQEEVLSHPAVGGFFTHCGWNSMLESLIGGVPMLCWPFFAEQTTNCRYACTEWGVGMEVGHEMKREKVEAMVRELMGGEKGKEMRNKALEWKEIALKAAAPGGSSYENLDKLINEVLLQPKGGKN